MVRLGSDGAPPIQVSGELFNEWAGCVLVLEDWLGREGEGMEGGREGGRKGGREGGRD